jgi:hypothetical protein
MSYSVRYLGLGGRSVLVDFSRWACFSLCLRFHLLIPGRLRCDKGGPESLVFCSQFCYPLFQRFVVVIHNHGDNEDEVSLASRHRVEKLLAGGNTHPEFRGNLEQPAEL